MADKNPIPLFPLQQGVFPDGPLALHIFEVRYLDLIKRSHRDNTPFGVAWLVEGQEVQVPGQTPSLQPWGCMAFVRRLETLQPALFHIDCQGGLRFRVGAVERGPLGVWMAQVDYLDPDPEVPIPPELQHLADRLGSLIAEHQGTGLTPHLALYRPYELEDCGWVANRWAEMLPFSTDQKLRLLAEMDPLERLRLVAEWVGN